MKLLYIDTDETYGGTLKRSLERGGVDVELHADGHSALDAARAESPDAIVVAVELGDRLTGGYTICQKLKKDEELRRIPLVLVSTQATPETFEQHKKLKNRAEEYLRKPFDAAELLDAVGRHVELPAGALDAVGATVHGAPIPMPDELFDADDDLLELDEAFDLLTSPDFEDKPIAASPVEPGFELGIAEELEPDVNTGTPVEVLPSPWTLDHEPGPEELRAQLEALESRLAATERELAEKTAEIEASRAIGDQNRDYFQLRNETARKEKEVLQLREELNRAERESLELRVAQTDLEQKLSVLQGELARKEALARNAMGRAESVSVAQRRAEGTIAALRNEASRVPELAAECERLEAKRLELESAVDGARATVTRLEAELLEAGAATTRLEEELATSRDEAARLGAERDEALAEAARLREEAALRDEKLARLDEELAAVRQELEARGAAADRARQALADALASLG